MTQKQIERDHISYKLRKILESENVTMDQRNSASRKLKLMNGFYNLKKRIEKLEAS